MTIILFILLVSLMFPSSSEGGRFEFMMIPMFIVCAALLVGSWQASAAGFLAVFIWLGLTDTGYGLLGLFLPIVAALMICGISARIYDRRHPA